MSGDYNQIVTDPGCDDDAAWSFVGFGASVSDSYIKFANPVIASSATIPVLTPVIDVEYEYSINIDRAPVSSIKERIHFGGVDIYNADGSGIKTGSIVATATTGLIMLMQFAGQLYIDWIKIYDTSIPEPAEEESKNFSVVKMGRKHIVTNSRPISRRRRR